MSSSSGSPTQRARDEHALLLAAGELADVAVGELADVELGQDRRDLCALGAAGPRQAPPADARHEHALATVTGKLQLIVSTCGT